MPFKPILGVLSPILTAFDKDGEIYDQGCQNILDFQLPHVNGFFICGSYGSGSLMSVEERKHVLEVMAAHINGRAPIIVHVGTTATQTTVELAQHAQSTGVDAIAVIPPFYYKHSEDNILAHFQAVLDAVDVPVFAYDYPKLSNNVISLKMLQSLADMGIVGVKDTTNDMSAFLERMATIQKKDFSFVVGTEALLLSALTHGAQACISGMANALPALLAELYQAILQGEHQKARQLQLTVAKARSIIKRAPAIASAYAIMQYVGIDTGFPRLPFQPVPEKQMKDVVKELEKMQVLER